MEFFHFYLYPITSQQLQHNIQNRHYLIMVPWDRSTLSSDHGPVQWPVSTLNVDFFAAATQLSPYDPTSIFNYKLDNFRIIQPQLQFNLMATYCLSVKGAVVWLIEINFTKTNHSFTDSSG